MIPIVSEILKMQMVPDPPSLINFLLFPESFFSFIFLSISLVNNELTLAEVPLTEIKVEMIVNIVMLTMMI